MQLSNAPGKIVLPFANGGDKNTIPVASSPTPGAASYTDGFPPDTSIPVEDGGSPPDRDDFNGILYASTALERWMSAGASFSWDSTFSTAVGGYPKGARVLRADGKGFWLCTIDNNVTNPNAGGAGWIIDGPLPFGSVNVSSSQTVASGGAKVVFDTVEFDPFGIWNSTDKRFQVPYSGVYRVSGLITMTAPDAQAISVQIWRNGAIYRNAFELPQTTDANLGYPFNVLVSMSANDYVEVYLFAAQTAVNLAPPPYVYCQIEMVGS